MGLVSCCVQGWSGALGGSGNFGLNPRFRNAAGPDGAVGTEDDDLRVRSSSPVIDRGDNALLPPDAFDLDGDNNTGETIPFDADGRPRIVKGWSSMTVDIGAYEYHGEDLSAWIPALDLAPPVRRVVVGRGAATDEIHASGAVDPAIRPNAAPMRGTEPVTGVNRARQWTRPPEPALDEANQP